ncbi:MAG: type II toxin-antitoxin system VapC family toxin [Anaerolineales bacterium]
MISWVCVDVGILLKLVLNEPDSDKAEALWRSWVITGRRPIAPPLFPYEITAVICKAIRQDRLSAARGQQALRQALAFGVRLSTFPGIHERALELSLLFNRPSAYEEHYLALAEKTGAEFWTADERLFNAVHEKLAWVRWLGEFRG